MSREEWEEIKQIFASALNVPEDERLDYVKAACGDRPDMYRTICELLSNHGDPSAFPAGGARLDEPVFKERDVVAGRFRIVRFIARGGMGEVYEAFDESLRLRLALKTIRPELTTDEDALNRFQREIISARDVAHESVCRVYDYVEHRKIDALNSGAGGIVHCLTMELLDGESLSSFLQKNRPLSPETALPIIRQIASGLDVLHDHGIVHRDLKPSNIMLARLRNGRVRAVVMDFGLAKAQDADSDLFESQRDMRAGAPYFMAPELLRQSRPSVAADIYALGLIIDEMVTSTRAFSASSTQALYFAKLWESPISPSLRSSNLPDQWVTTILRCIDAEPAKRFSRAGDIVRALEEPPGKADPEPLPVVPSRNPIPVEANPARKRLTRRFGILAAAVSLAVLTAFAAVKGLAFHRTPASVEVFDIENRTQHPEYDYLCKGTTNELMRRLSELDGVRVIPLYSKRAGAPRHMQGRFSLDGALQAYNGQMRLSVTVIDNQEHTLAWSQNFDRKEFSNPLALQSDIAQGTVTALRDRLIGNDASASRKADIVFPVALRLRKLLSPPLQFSLARAPTSSDVAFDLYMRGQHLLEESSPHSTLAAIDYLKQAVGQDSNFALAHAALADACIRSMDDSLVSDPELFNSARDHAERAVQCEPGLAEAHAARAEVRQVAWDWQGAEESYREALHLKPTFSRARLWYAGLILQFGRRDEAIENARRAFEQDPYDRSTPRAYGLYLYLAGRYQEAASVLATAVAGKEMPTARHNLGQVYAQLGSMSNGKEAAEYYRKALAEAETVATIERRSTVDGSLPRPSIANRMFALFYAQAGNLTEAQPYVDRVEEDVNAGRTSPVVLAWIHAIRGNQSAALDLLERAARAHDRRLLYIKVTPYFEKLRGNARFEAVLSQVHL